MARRLYEEGLAIAREAGQRWLVGLWLYSLGQLAHQRSDYPLARSLYQDSLAMARELGEKAGIARALHGLGLVARSQGDVGEARSRFEESLAIFRELNHPLGIAALLAHLGLLFRENRNQRAARAHLEESLHFSLALTNQQPIPATLQGLLRAFDLGSGAPLAAHSLLSGSLILSRGWKGRVIIVACLEELAQIAQVQGQPERAARLLGAASALLETIGGTFDSAARFRYDRSVSALRAALGEEAFAAAWADGRAMTLEQAVAHALELPQSD